MTHKVVIVPHDQSWRFRFETDKLRLRGALGVHAKQVEHIGSTSVYGLAAKPIVDILVSVNDPLDDKLRWALERAGYKIHVDEDGHRMFRTNDRAVHVHLWPTDSGEIGRHLRFRDWLRAHPSDRVFYENEKRSLAKREWRTQNDYATAKSSVIERILERAEAHGSAKTANGGNARSRSSA